MKDVQEQLRELETELLSSVRRRSAERVSTLLADEFREFGSSGRVFSRAQVVEALGTERLVYFTISDFQVKLLDDAVALITYRALKREEGSEEQRASLRSSIWVRRDGRWQMLFHQGTHTAEGE